MLLHADSKYSDQTGRMPRLIGVFAGRPGNFVGFVMLWLNFIYLFDIGRCSWDTCLLYILKNTTQVSNSFWSLLNIGRQTKTNVKQSWIET